MDYFYAVISLLAGLGAFLMGFKILSENTEKLADSKLKKLFNKTAKSKLVGVGIGAVATAVVQSSSATTVMVVGFVNAGIMSLMQATAIIMGANIGTTITAQIVALESFDLVKIAMVLTLVGVFMNMFFKTDKVKTIGSALSGLGLVFLGLNVMSQAMEIFRESEIIVHAFTVIKNPFLLLLIGLGVTAIVQSSSAVTTIIIAIVAQDIVIGNGGNSVLYVVLGTNIGTCVTAIISAIGASANAKRASLIHLMFNVFGSIIMMIVMLCWPSFMDSTFASWFTYPATQIAMFHTFFNVFATIIFLPFSKWFVRLSEILIKDKKAKKTDAISYLDERMLKSPSIALAQVQKEIVRMSDMGMEILGKALEAFVKKDTSVKTEIEKINTEIEGINKNIIDYLVAISSNDPSYSDEKLISSMHHVLGDVIRISEIADNVTKYTSHEIRDDLHFSTAVKEAILRMYEEIKELYKDCVDSFLSRDFTKLKDVDEKEDEIDSMKRVLVESHIKRLNEGECKPESSGIFINLVGNLERVADHLTFIAHSIEK